MTLSVSLFLFLSSCNVFFFLSVHYLPFAVPLQNKLTEKVKENLIVYHQDLAWRLNAMKLTKLIDKTNLLCSGTMLEFESSIVDGHNSDLQKQVGSKLCSIS